MRALSWRLSLVLALGVALPASVLAGPKAPRTQPILAPSGATDGPRTSRTHTNAQDVADALAPLATAIGGLVGPVATPEFNLLSDEKAYFDLAGASGESDATVFFDARSGTIYALDQELTGNRLRILAHETARAELHTALGTSPAAWFDEGFACYVETAEETDTNVVLGRVDQDRKVRARAELRRGKERGLERLFRLEGASFERGERVHRDVALAWGVVHYLVHGGTRPKHAFDAYVRTLRETHDGARAQAALLKVIPRAELARDLEEYLRRI